MVTHALIRFLRIERSAGRTRATIVPRLLEKGWKEADIEQAFFVVEHTALSAIPRPQKGSLAEFTELLCSLWDVFRSRWTRFVGAVILYGMGVFFVELAFYSWVSPVLPRLMAAMRSGDVESAFFFALPYASVGLFGYIILQLWFLGTMYSIALKKGMSVFDRAQSGLERLPALFGIKVVIALLLMISFVPVLAVSFLTQNPIVFIVFGPAFILGAVFLGFLCALAVPAYFSGIPWRDATLKSIQISFKNILPLAKNYVYFGLFVFVLFFVVGGGGVMTTALLLGFIVPMQALFMISMYRRFAPDALEPESKNTFVVAAEKVASKRPARTKRIPKV